MNLDRRAALSRLAGLGALVSLGGLSGPAWSAALPGDSIYQLDAALTDQDGQALTLASLRGRPLLLSMFYTSCDMVCPMIFETIKATLLALPKSEAERMKILLISFDPERDTVAVLKQTARARGGDARWTLARCDAGTVRKLAAVLGFQYRRLASGEFNHSSLIELLDAEGRVKARSGKLGSVDPDLLAAIRQLDRPPAPHG
ncbi:MAG TPA: SCO family protein [Burkholderiaceae bacterium]